MNRSDQVEFEALLHSIKTQVQLADFLVLTQVQIADFLVLTQVQIADFQV